MPAQPHQRCLQGTVTKSEKHQTLKFKHQKFMSLWLSGTRKSTCLGGNESSAKT